MRRVLWLVTRGVHLPEGGTDERAIHQGAIWGLGRTITLEHAELCSTLVDLSATDWRKKWSR
jgi:hypothetical protein